MIGFVGPSATAEYQFDQQERARKEGETRLSPEEESLSLSSTIIIIEKRTGSEWQISVLSV
jgi:hypothetical protein